MSKQGAVKKASVEEKFRQAGYISMDEAAQRIGVHYDTIRRWAEAQEVTCVHSTKTWVSVGSLARKFGLEASVIAGLISADQAATLRKTK